jgi:hypothetical protein
MGSISRLVAEIFLQFNENLLVKRMLESKNIVFYNRQVVNMLIRIDSQKITAEEILNY